METVGVEKRGKFYEATGALRDMVPNHVLSLLSLVAMEPPARFDAGSIRNKKTGMEARAQIVLPNGFEYAVADIGSASSRTSGPVEVAFSDSYGQFANLHLSTHGVVRA